MNYSKRNVALATMAFLAVGANALNITMNPVSTFGPGGLRAGWLENSELPARLDINNTSRGLAYNAATGHLLLLSRVGGNNIVVLYPNTGAELSTMNMGTGVISGGAIGVSKVVCSSDGQIFATNVSTGPPTSPYKVYRWANEGDTLVAANAFSVVPLTGARAGDTLDLMGSGNDIMMVAGYSNSPAIAGNNSFCTLKWDGTTVTATHMPITANGQGKPAAGDFRLGISFIDSTTVIGSQFGTNSMIAQFDQTTPTNSSLLAAIALTAGNEKSFDVATVGGVPLLATVDVGSGAPANSGTLVCRIYDITNPVAPVALGSARIPTSDDTASLEVNGNGSGHVVFGNISGTSARVYFLTTNNGIQAFDVAIAAGSLMGTVNLGAEYVGDMSTVPVTFRFRNVGSTTDIAVRTVNLAADGTYSVKPALAPGTYDVTCEGPTWLRNNVGTITFTTDDVTDQNVSILNGDCDNNNLINTDDYLILSGSFDLVVGDPNFVAGADLDGNGLVNTDDYLILSNNFDNVGVD